MWRVPASMTIGRLVFITVLICIPGVRPDRIDCLIQSNVQYCLDLNVTEVSWDVAWSSCKSSGSRLALLDTVDKDRMVSDYLDKQQDGNVEMKVWFGQRQLDDPVWKWTTNRLFQVNSTQVQVNFTTARPMLRCATVTGQPSGSVLYQNAMCKNLYNYICQQPAANDSKDLDACKIGDAGNGLVVSGYCHVPYKTPTSWFQANENCNSMSARLTVLDETSSSEASNVASSVLQDTVTPFWVGLRRNPVVNVLEYDTGKNNCCCFGEGDSITAWLNADEEMKFKKAPPWLTSSKVASKWTESTVSSWLADEPNIPAKNCTAYSSSPGSIGWMALACSQPAASFICETVTIITTTTLATTTPSANSTSGESVEEESELVSIVLPCVLVGAAILAAIITLGCYCSKKRSGYEQHA